MNEVQWASLKYREPEEDHFYFLKTGRMPDSGALQVKPQMSESAHQRILCSQPPLKFGF